MREPTSQCARELVTGAIVLAVATLAVAGGHAGQELEPTCAAFEKRRCAVAFVGNSTTNQGIDEATAEATLGAPAAKLSGDGSGTALWWLLLKNVIVHAKPPPRLVCLLYRDHELTNPALGITGEPAMEIATATTAAEPELDDLAYEPAMGPLRRLAYRRWPLWRARDSAPKLLDRFVLRRVVAPLFGCTPEQGETAYWNVLGDRRMDRARLTAYQFRANDALLRTELDFDAQFRASFLPRMVDVARAAGSRIVLVRIRTRKDALGEPMPEANRRYGERTAAWCARHDVPLLDFRGDATLTEELFGFGDHLNAAGARFFTRKLCEALAPLR